MAAPVGSESHQDVYKRQDEEYRDIVKIVRYHTFQIDKKDGVEKRNITAPDRRIKAVSYTHLDVYKRQLSRR